MAKKQKKTIVTFLMLLTLGWSFYTTFVKGVSEEFGIPIPILLLLILIIYFFWKDSSES